MKLYNLYQNVILEEIIRLVQLTEAVPTNDIDKVLAGDPNKEGKFYHVSFDYKEKDGTVSNRWVQIYQTNLSITNNGLIDAYQVSKNGKSSNPSGEKHTLTGWKKFRLDRMSNFKVSKVPFYQEPKPYIVKNKKGKIRIAKLNKTGNGSPTVKQTYDIANIGSYQYSDSTLKNKAYAEKRKQASQQTKPVEQPITQPKTKPQAKSTQQTNVSKNKEEDLNNL